MSDDKALREAAWARSEFSGRLDKTIEGTDRQAFDAGWDAKAAALAATPPAETAIFARAWHEHERVFTGEAAWTFLPSGMCARKVESARAALAAVSPSSENTP